VAKKPQKERPKPIERFPQKFHFAISNAMNDSLKRLTGGNSLLAEADIGRLALHAYLLQNDPYYARQFGVLPQCIGRQPS
jgi:hypothetical protein